VKATYLSVGAKCVPSILVVRETRSRGKACFVLNVEHLLRFLIVSKMAQSNPPSYADVGLFSSLTHQNCMMHSMSHARHYRRQEESRYPVSQCLSVVLIKEPIILTRERTDPARALKYITSSLALLSPYPFHKSCDPFLAISRLHQALLIHELGTLPEPTSVQEQESRDAKVDETCRAAARVVSGVCEDRIFCFGHPVRGVALAELGKLLCVDVSPNASGNNNSTNPESESWSRIPRGTARLQLAAQVLVRAQKELEIGFGKGGGEVGKGVRKMLIDLEREIGAWKRIERSGAIQKLGNVGGGNFAE